MEYNTLNKVGAYGGGLIGQEIPITTQLTHQIKELEELLAKKKELLQLLTDEPKLLRAFDLMRGNF